MQLILENLFTFGITMISFIVLLSFIVFFHELGHFQTARWCGVKIDVFSIGFGKPLFSRKDRHGTEWRVAMLPLGGFVKFFGDAGPASDPSEKVQNAERARDSDESGDEPKPMMTQFPPGSEKARLAENLTEEERRVCFHFKPLWQKALIVAAGPFANFVLAVVILTGLFMMAGEVPVYEAQVGTVQEGTAAEEAGLQSGDRIEAINGRKVNSFQQMSNIVKLSSGEQLELVINRGGEIMTLTAMPIRTETLDAYGNKVRAGILGIGSDPDAYRMVRYGPFGAVKAAVGQVYEVLAVTVRFLGRIILGKEGIEQLGGPVKIAKYAGQSAMAGFSDGGEMEVSLVRRLEVSFFNFLNMAAMISISVGFLNLLPVPVLDGGHLVFYGYEAVAGRPVSEAVQAVSFKIGIVILLSLMVFVSWNDVTQLFTS
ncbi:RIP metalloprotease RseP [Aquisalinus flavus]|uniref:Zinc metalloprotease n=1 Tax=Aquisalinus flavus TaxID=1526572 RepID=A0A8J2V1S3_9PROT|nr:RIP metalloprotease RseP [Aquisalinus flavus]MBD0427810.1 RIP metalloprotease RseP [Aquisalinus flavus]UNE47582.1 RIP metalloprotease RseP [Aquisalinus flavus]GGD04002.1 putative zinc metalloprotease [Aquisalinus flavus]